MQYHILFEGSVFAMAELNKAARTGVYFVLLNLAEAFMERSDVSLGIIVAPRDLQMLKRALSGQRLFDCIGRSSQFRLGEQKIVFISTFFPIHQSIKAIRYLAPFQIIYDLAFHACHALSGNKDFERAVVASLGSEAHALCISDNTRKDLNRYFGIPFEQSSTFYPGVRKDILNAERSERDTTLVGLGVPPNVPYILSLSTLEPRKNLATALRAFVSACELLPHTDLHFILVGLDGWGRQLALLDSIPDEFRRRIRPIGYVNDNIIPALLRGAVCLLYPSLYEGFGFPPLEAMSCGTPVIVSNAGSLPEVVSYGGRIVDAYDHVGMAKIIKTWVSCPDERLYWSDQGRQRAKEFSWSGAVASIIDSIRANPLFRE